MSVSEDLINFDIIETQKENIQSLPQGRSAKALASSFAPSPFSPLPTPGSTRNLNDAIRAEYEAELSAINDSDDPLDIYDRYVKWTFNAYPSAQATPDSQLRPLLERATKSFQSTSHYKNDPRYLKLWLQYIRFFSDAPRETFAYLARHSIGEGLALYYEEFAAWLEGADRWSQAEEVYKLGIEREARPAERLLRKFGEFQQRFEARPTNDEEPSSPAIPMVRPALAAKLDPFATSTPRSSDPQSQRLPSNSVASRSGRQKLAIFSDADGSLAGKSESGDASKGWDNIGSIRERKKENIIEAKPWAGETLKTGKKVGTASKMAVFRDSSSALDSNPDAPAKLGALSPFNATLVNSQETVNPKTGRTERIRVDLLEIYPGAIEERSFEEVMAQHRGWLEKTWKKEKLSATNPAPDPTPLPEESVDEVSQVVSEKYDEENISKDLSSNDIDSQEVTSDVTFNEFSPSQGTESRQSELKEDKPRRKKMMEVKAETQTVKTNLASPTAAKKLRRKSTAEPTMTLHTRAATDEVLDMFNQTLRDVASMTGPPESGPESDYEDDDYTSGGDSTGTGRISGNASEYGDETEVIASSNTGAETEVTDVKSVSPWSEFTRSKHVPKLDGEDETVDEEASQQVPINQESQEEIVTPVMRIQEQHFETKFVPVPPEDVVAPTHPYRDIEQMNQSRLPFMTPIVERTEASVHLPSTHRQNDYFNSKTPSRRRNEADPALPEIENLLIDDSSQEVTENTTSSKQTQSSEADFDALVSAAQERRAPLIEDAQCNPVDDSIRSTILENLQPPLTSFPGYFDHRPQTLNKGPEIRRYIKALLKNNPSKSSSEKTFTALSSPPILDLPSTSPSAPPTTLTIKRELGKGGYAPVYLAECHQQPTQASPTQPSLLALKAESPPSPWEFHILTLSHSRLRSSPCSLHNRATTSLTLPYAFHRFADEAYLLESYHDQGTLLDLVNATKADALAAAGSAASATPGLEEVVAMFFSLELLRTLEALHAVGILHGDLKGDNCLVRLSPSPSPHSATSGSGSSSAISPSEGPGAKGDGEWSSAFHPDGSHGWDRKGLVLIDFGRGIDTHAFREGVQFVADWKTDRQDCPEMREARPWSWQVDLWGAAGVVHVLLFGRVIEETVLSEARGEGNRDGEGEGAMGGGGGLGGMAGKKRYKPREPLKRYWATELWGDVFDVLMNPGCWVDYLDEGVKQAGKLPPTRRLKEVRERMEEWLVEHGERKGLKAALRRVEERVRGRGR